MIKLLIFENSIYYEIEYPIDGYAFDFWINTVLIDIDPSFTRSYTDTYQSISDTNYHLKKTELGEKYRFRVIHVFDGDSWDKIVMPIDSRQSIVARNCLIKEIKSDKEVKQFLNNYHIQNSCKGQIIKLGLYYQDNLVEVMTYGKPRYNSKYQYELLRLCSCDTYTILGGASKLFKYMIDHYHPESIISYCDRSKFTGNVYEKIGMHLDHISSLGITWSKGQQKLQIIC